MATPAAIKPNTIKSPSDDSEYSDVDPDPNRITKRQRKPRRRREACSPRLAEIAQPIQRTYQCLYHQHGWIMHPLRAARIRRKLEDINVMTLEELEDQLAARAEQAKAGARRKKRAERQTFAEYGGAKLDELFERVAKHLTKRMVRRPLVKPLIVSAATKRLIDYSLDVVDNAMETQRRAGGVKDLVCGCPQMEREERQMRLRVAQEMAMMAKQVYFETQPSL